MKITPMDIQHAEFKRQALGYNREEVDAFLDRVTNEYEALIKEHAAVKERLATLDQQGLDIRAKEQQLTNTLLSSQQLVEDMKTNAQRQAELLLREAEMRAHEVNKLAREEAKALQRDVMDLQRHKAMCLEKFRSLLQAFEKSLDLEEAEDKESSLL